MEANPSPNLSTGAMPISSAETGHTSPPQPSPLELPDLTRHHPNGLPPTAAPGTSSSPNPTALTSASSAAVNTSRKSARAASHSHNLSSSSSIGSSIASRKSRHAEPNTTEANSQRASLSMPPPFSRPQQQQAANQSLRSPRSSLPHSRRQSSNSDAWSEELIPTSTLLGSEYAGLGSLGFLTFPGVQTSPRDFAYEGNHDTEDFETPRMPAGSSIDQTPHQQLPEPALSSKRSSFSDIDAGKRMSVSSMFSLASARGVPSSAASANGSDNNRHYRRSS